METLTFLKFAQMIIEEEKRPLTVEEIWNIGKLKGLDKKLKSKGKTPWATLGARLYVEVRDNKNSPFIYIDARPKRFFLKYLSSDIENIENLIKEPLPKEVGFTEKDLHPFLSYFNYYYLKSYSKTIEHTKSGKKEYGEWVHPDMVSCYFPIEEWKPEVFEFSSSIGNVSIKLFSFEIKKDLNFSNLRESFFQTVSNSSWANEGYLVAANITKDEGFMDELKRLSSSFGIGVIQLNLEDPDSSEVIFPAKLKDILDWDTINKLSMNPDFKDFLKRIKNDISSKEIRKEKYNRILEKDDLLKTINKK